MSSRDTRKEFDENNALQSNVDDVQAKESSSLGNPLSDNDRSEAVEEGYISKVPFFTWTLAAVIGIAFCLIHSHQDSLWQWTGETAAEAQSLQAKVVVSVFSVVIGGCMVAVLSKALASISFLVFRYHGASFSYLTTVMEGYTASRILTLVAGKQWASSMLIVSILLISAATKQLAVVSMGVELMSTNSTKTSYTRNYTDCLPSMDTSSYDYVEATVAAQAFNSIAMPNSSYTNENYDSSIPISIAGYSQFERVLPYADALCVKFTDTYAFETLVPPVTSLGNWNAKVTLQLTPGTPDNNWMNCTVTAGWANAISTCNDTKCDTTRTSAEIAPLAERLSGVGLPAYLQSLFNKRRPTTSKINNIVVDWLFGKDILTGIYTDTGDQPTISTPESVAGRLAILGTTMTRTICDINSFLEDDINDNEPTILESPITSNYTRSYYQYRVLWKWPFYVLAGCIFALWLLCIVAMWLAPESRVLNIDWLLNQYISRHHRGYLSGADLLPDHQGVVYQVYDDNAAGDVGNIIITSKESRRLGKYDRVVQDKQYQ